MFRWTPEINLLRFFLMVFEPVFYDVFRQQSMRQQEDVTQERTAIRLSIQNFDVVHTKLIRVIFFIE